MIKEVFSFQDAASKTIYAYKWFRESNALPKAVILIIHGMAEHAQRYELFANSLVDAGYLVYANDHRGHGKTAGSINNTGYFADSDGWKIVIENINQLKIIIAKNNPNIPLFVFGHSMGSLLLRNLIYTYPENIQGIILSGTSHPALFLIKLGRTIAEIQKILKGKKHRSKLLDKLSFGSFNKKFKPVKTAFDWLSTDDAEVEKYMMDDYCGFCCTTQFYVDLFNGLQRIQNKSNIRNIPKNIPVFIIAGSDDAVGNFTKGTAKVEKLLSNAGIQDVSLKFYTGARHELTNETIKHLVFKDIIGWIETKKASV